MRNRAKSTPTPPAPKSYVIIASRVTQLEIEKLGGTGGLRELRQKKQSSHSNPKVAKLPGWGGMQVSAACFHLY
eukprot:m.443310 g.443310  ORF g.443310 m.443310 type:complete len:74 (-) comp18952_c0_seq1:3459-3680(-)